ncbi:MAG: AAA family ATPase [Candidatus Sungbacteria bacterium]|nr:AAA family ATPase [bacterium]MDZ4260616.1 AAA family ATPase [Candidatus Sungbacteria bacterium]
MIYKSFRIKNFKGIDEVNVDLVNSRIITLVGLNESGKTSIMEGVQLFYRIAKGENPSTEQLNEFRPKGINFTGTIEVSASLILEDADKKKIENYWKNSLNKRNGLELPDELRYDIKFKYELHTYKSTDRTWSFDVKTKNSKRGLHETDNAGWNALIYYIKSEIVPEILYYDDFIFQIPEKVCFVKTGIAETEEVSNKNNKIWQLVVADVLKAVDDRMSFQNHVVDVWETDRDAASNRLSQMEKALDEKITNRWGDLFGKNKINFKEIKLDPEYTTDGKLYLSFKIRTESKKEFLVRERSKGFKWFFSFLLFTEFRKKRTRNILFLLDEPASNLHSSAQAKILEALQELSTDSLVIYSTHSHHLINPEWLIGAYICINENLSDEVLEGGLSLEERAKITAVKYFTYVGKGLGSDNVSYFQPILDRLDYQPSIVEPIPDIVILEGKNDWYTLRYFEEVILKRKSKLNFYPGSGRDKLSDIIRLYLAWGKKFIVLLDGDDGIKSQSQYIKEFGEFVKDRIFTIKDALNKKVAIEGLIGVMDQRELYDGIFGKGSYNECKKKSPKRIKENLNYALNQLQLQKKEVSLNKTTQDNFTKLLDFAAEKLKLVK